MPKGQCSGHPDGQNLAHWTKLAAGALSARTPPTGAASAAGWLLDALFVTKRGLGPWVEAAATVAVASLDGPVAGGRALVGELIKRGAGAWQQGAEARELQRRVREAVSGWAREEKIDETTLRLGVELAGEVFATCNVDNRRIAQLGFDPQVVGDAVLACGKATDRYWGGEEHYAVAEKAIRVMVGVLVPQVRDDQALMSVVIEQSQQSRSELAAIAAVVSGQASRGEIMQYLRARAEDWDASVLDLAGRRPSLLRRHLRVVKDCCVPNVHVDRPSAEDRGCMRGEQDGHMIGEDEALSGESRLVILGGPGSGKTWLARRYARDCALEALHALERGAQIWEVELPVLTTWEAWALSPGEVGEALVAASFDASLGYRHLGDATMVSRLKRTLGSHHRVMAIVDSLDEAADGYARQRWEGLSTTPWRVIITSRPGAWAALTPRTSNTRVVYVQDLSYPSDVAEFIAVWFEGRPEAGADLISQIDSREDLRRNSVVPLILTMYCLLADGSGSGLGLPRRRRDLYRSIVRRMLLGRWANVIQHVEDIHACEIELARWAWCAVEHQVSPVGLGVWQDAFIRPRPGLTGPLADAVGHVAPVMSWREDGTVLCRFVHRTLLEHFVAEQIATFDTSTAAEILFPHLWFDPDWAAAVPSAIAAHNQNHGHTGELLAELLRRGQTAGADLAQVAADHQLDEILLDIAVETDPDEWPEHLRVHIDTMRIRCASTRPSAVSRSSHWGRSNSEAIDAIVPTLTTVDAWAVAGLVGALEGLGPSEADRARALEAVLAALTTVDDWAVAGLVEALEGLRPSEADRARVLEALLNSSSATDQWSVRRLVAGLPELSLEGQGRARALEAVLAALPIAAPGVVGGLVGALEGLGPSEADRARALEALLNSSSATDPWFVSRLVAGLPVLSLEGQGRVRALEAVLAALTTVDAWAVAGLVGALEGLGPSEADRARALEAVLAALSIAAPRVMAGLVGALKGLGPSEADRARALEAVLAALPIAAPRVMADVLAALTSLDPSEEERAQTFRAISSVLPRADPGVVPLIAGLRRWASASDWLSAIRCERRSKLGDVGTTEGQGGPIAQCYPPRPCYVGPEGDLRRYSLLRSVGGGGEGDVWEGRYLPDLLHEPPLRAVKIFDPPENWDGAWPQPDDVERWQDLCRLLGDWPIDNLVKPQLFFYGKRTYDAGALLPPDADQWVFCAVMDWVDGVDLPDVIASRPATRATIGERLGYIRDVAAVIRALHSRSFSQGNPVQSCDIKPDNCMLRASDGRVVVIDITSMRLVDDPRESFGGLSRLYAAPEVRTDSKAHRTSAADVYSLGALAVYCLLGEAVELGDGGTVGPVSRPAFERDHSALRERLATLGRRFGFDDDGAFADTVIEPLAYEASDRPDVGAWVNRLSAWGYAI